MDIEGLQTAARFQLIALFHKALDFRNNEESTVNFFVCCQAMIAGKDIRLFSHCAAESDFYAMPVRSERILMPADMALCLEINSAPKQKKNSKNLGSE